MLFTLPVWETLTPYLQHDALPGNLHCLAHAMHALLSMAEAAEAAAEPPKEDDAAAAAGGAASKRLHCRFLEVAALVVLRHRQALDPRGQVEVNKERLQARERSLGAMLLLLEQLALLADPLSAAMLKPYLPHALLSAQYTQIWQLSADSA